ncbi:hypothetical protein GCM10027431_06170 [Lysobacter rhizosphaerae]
MKTRHFLWLPLCMLAGSAVSGGAMPLQAIVLDPGVPAGELLEVWVPKSGPIPKRIDATLELGEETGGRILRVLQADGDASRYRVSVQFETSMGIDGEGPHIDLLDWKHCRSEWRPAQPVGTDGFRLPVPHDGDDTCFPHATREELRQAVRDALGPYDFGQERNQQWLGLVEQAPRVGEFPSYVAISMVRVRIERRDGNEWSLLTTIEFSVPMGC